MRRGVGARGHGMGGGLAGALHHLLGAGVGRGPMAPAMLDVDLLQRGGDYSSHGRAVGCARDRHIDPTDRDWRRREITRPQGNQVPVDGDGTHAHVAASPLARGDHRRAAARFGSGNDDYIPRPYGAQRVLHGLPGRRPTAQRLAGLHESAQLLGVTQLAGGALLEPRDHPSHALQLRLELHHGRVAAVLRERQVQQVVRGVGPVAPHEVGGHVVGRAERGGERVGARRREPGHLAERHIGRPQHDRVPDLVDAATPRSTGELGVLAGGEELVALARELAEPFDHDRPRRHVDPERERLGGEDDLHQCGREALLYRLLERRHHARVVRGDARLQRGNPLAVAEDAQVVIRQRRHFALGDGANPFTLLRRRQPQAEVEALSDRVGTRGATEDEIDRRQHVAFAQQVDDFGPARCVQGLSPAPAHGRGVARRAAVEGGGLGVGPSVHQRGQEVDPIRAAVAEQVQVVQQHRAPFFDDRRRRSAHGLDPVGELLGVGHRGGQAHEVDVGRRVDDHLLPDGAAVSVLQEVDLVQHDVPQAPQRGGLGVDHVAQHFGGHHDDGRVTVDGVVAREEPHPLRAVPPHQIAVLLVRQRLEGRRVEGLLSRGERAIHRVLGDDGLARSCGGRDQHRAAFVDGIHRLDLEGVRCEAQTGHEVGALGRDAHRFRNRPARIDSS